MRLRENSAAWRKEGNMVIDPVTLTALATFGLLVLGLVSFAYQVGRDGGSRK